MTGTVAASEDASAAASHGGARTAWPNRVAPWAPAALGCLLLAEAVRWELPAAAAVKAVLAIAVLHVAPGVVVWRLVRPRQGWWLEDLVLGTAIGGALGIGAQTLAGTFRLPLLAWIVPVLVGTAPLVVGRSRRRVRDRVAAPVPPTLSLGVGLVGLLLVGHLQTLFRAVPLAWDTGFRTTYVDMPYHLSLAAEIATRGPGAVPYVTGEGLHYHWFSHAWVAHVARASGTGLDEVLYRVMPVVVPVVLLCAVAVVAFRLSGTAWVGWAAAAIALLSNDLSLFGVGGDVTSVNGLSPSLTLSSLFLIALVAVLAYRWSGAGEASGAASRSTLLLVGGLAFAAAGAKGSALPVLVGGAALAAVFGTPATRRVVVVDLVTMVAALGLAFVALFAGQTSGTEVDPVSAVHALRFFSVFERGDGTGALLVGMVVVAVWASARGAGAIGVLTDPRRRRDPVVLVLVGAGLTGVAAVATLSHFGMSQLYFLRNAMPVLAIVAAIGLGEIWSRHRAHRPQLVAGASAGALLVLLFVGRVPVADGAVAGALRLASLGLLLGATAWAVRRAADPASRRWLGAGVAALALTAATVMPTVAHVVLEPAPEPQEPAEPDVRDTFAAEHIVAARWLRDHSDVDDLVATNRHCTSPPAWVRCDARRFAVTAYTERRVLVEGWAYTSTWIEQPDVIPHPAYKPFWDQELLAVNDAVFTDPTQENVRALRDLGVRWLFVDKTVPASPALASVATPRFETAWAWVLELR